MTLTLLSGLFGLAVSIIFVGVLWRRRGEPTAFPLLGVAVFVCVAILATLSVLELSVVHDYTSFFTGLDDQLWLLPAFIYTIIALGLWVIFAFQYTGRGDRMTIVTFILVGVLVSFILGPLTADALVGFEPALALSNFSTFVASFVMAALSFVSLLFIVDESLRMGGYRITEAVLLGGGVLTLALAPLAGTVTQLPLAFFTLLAASSGFFVIAVAPLSLFSVLPVARVIGREQLINEFDAAVVVADSEGTVRDINPAGEELFDSQRGALLGEPVNAVFSRKLSHAERLSSQIDDFQTGVKEGRTGEQPTVRFRDGRTATVTIDPVTDARGNRFGQLFLFQDVTERHERERRLGVLNQLLIGTLREQMDTVASEARDVCSAEQSPESRKELSQSIWGTTTELLELTEYVREVDRILSTHENSGVVVQDTIRETAAAHELRLQFETETGAVTGGDSEKWPSQTVSGITTAQFSLLLETAIATLIQEPDTERLRIITPDGNYTIHPEESQMSDRPALKESISTELLGLVADHLGISVQRANAELRISLPPTVSEPSEYTSDSAKRDQIPDRQASVQAHSDDEVRSTHIDRGTEESQ